MSDTRDLAQYQKQHLSPFGGNRSAASAYQRVERIAAAAHLVTNFVPEHEPVRDAIRSKSIQLLGTTLLLRSGFRGAGPERVNDIIAELLELTTLFEVANAAGFISKMNAEMLRRACADVADHLRSREDASESEAVSFNQAYFKVPEEPPRAPAARGEIKDKSIGQRNLKDTSVAPKKTEKARGLRRDAILQFVRENKDVSIKDVVSAVPGYSEKTIQRELMALVDEGVLRKEGERRWSRYILSHSE